MLPRWVVFFFKKRMMGECSKQAQKSSAVVDPCDTMTSLSFQTHLKFGPFIDFVWHMSDWSNVLCRLPESSARQKTRRRLFGWSLLRAGLIIPAGSRLGARRSPGRSARINALQWERESFRRLPAGDSQAARSGSLSSPRRISTGSQSLIIPALMPCFYMFSYCLHSAGDRSLWFGDVTRCG